VWRHNKPKTKNLLGKPSCQELHRHLITAHHSDRKNPPPREGFLFTIFPTQEPGGRGPPSKNVVQIGNPPEGGGFFRSTRMRRSQLLGRFSGVAILQTNKQSNRFGAHHLLSPVIMLCIRHPEKKERKKCSVPFPSLILIRIPGLCSFFC